MQIVLGCQVRDSISGFEGTATGRAEYLHGAASVQVTPAAIHEGKPVESQWFTESQLSTVDG